MEDSPSSRNRIVVGLSLFFILATASCSGKTGDTNPPDAPIQLPPPGTATPPSLPSGTKEVLDSHVDGTQAAPGSPASPSRSTIPSPTQGAPGVALPTPISTPASDYLIAACVYQGGSEEIDLVSLDGLIQTRLVSNSGDDNCNPAWSSDGLRIAFTSRQQAAQYVETSIWMVNVDGTGLTNISTTFSIKNPWDYPRWSPDGQSFAMVSERGENRDIIVNRVDGTERRPITDHPGLDENPFWAPDGEEIYYVSDQEGTLAIYAVGALGGESRKLADFEAMPGLAIWSPDGKKIATAFGEAGLSITDLVTGDTVHVDLAETMGWGAKYNIELRWSPDGSRLALISYVEHPPTLYVVGADGKGLRSLSDLSFAESIPSPSWSPDGSQIIYTDYDPACDPYGECNFDIYAVAVDNGQVRRLTQQSSDEWLSLFSPDGRYILFASDPGRSGENEGLYVMNRDGTGQRQLLRGVILGASWRPLP